MLSLLTICVVLLTVIRFWEAEFGKVLDAIHPIARVLRFSVWHNDYTKDRQLYHGPECVRLTAGAAVRQLSPDRVVQLLISGRPTLSNWLVPVSRHSATKLHAMYNNMSSQVSDDFSVCLLPLAMSS